MLALLPLSGLSHPLRAGHPVVRALRHQGLSLALPAITSSLASLYLPVCKMGVLGNFTKTMRADPGQMPGAWETHKPGRCGDSALM